MAVRKYHRRLLLHDPFSELLKDETSEADLVTPTLPAFRSLLAVSCHPSVRERYGKLIHGLLSSCLLNVDEMRFDFEILTCLWESKVTQGARRLDFIENSQN
jgi:hypothetical protein